jgi:transposase-like protein
VGGDQLDCGQDRLHGRDVAELGAASQARSRLARRRHDGAKIKALERETRELRQAKEILRKASAYFAQAELDRPFKR